MRLTIFGNSTLVRALTDLAPVPSSITIVEGTGPDVSRRHNLDALIVTIMQAERFGVDPTTLPLDKAQVLRTPVQDVARGLPRYFVASVRMKTSTPRDWSGELANLLESAHIAIVEFNTSSADRIENVGIVAENLLLRKLEPRTVLSVIAKSWDTRDV